MYVSSVFPDLPESAAHGGGLSIAIWNRNRVVTVAAACVWVTNIAFLVQSESFLLPFASQACHSVIQTVFYQVPRG